MAQTWSTTWPQPTTQQRQHSHHGPKPSSVPTSPDLFLTLGSITESDRRKKKTTAATQRPTTKKSVQTTEPSHQNKKMWILGRDHALIDEIKAMQHGYYGFQRHFLFPQQGKEGRKSISPHHQSVRSFRGNVPVDGLRSGV